MPNTPCKNTCRCIPDTNIINKQDLVFFDLPISGEFFPIQLGQLLLVLKSFKRLDKKNPDIVFSSSGGNISAYLCHTNDWDPNRIVNNLGLFNSEAFLTSWLDKMPFNFFSFLLSKSLFCKGYGFESFFKYFYGPNKETGYSPKAESGTEIISGVVCMCKKNKKVIHKTYSNKCCEKKSILIKNKINTNPYMCEDEDIIYMKGNVKEISQITVNSASIPFLVPSHEDNECFYSDGGSLFASPFTMFSSYIFEMGKNVPLPPSITTDPKNNKIIKGFFFNSNNCDEEPVTSIDFIITELKSLILGIYVQELRFFINTISSFPNMTPAKSPIKHCNVTDEDLYNIIKECEETNYHYGIMLYPNYNEKSTINLTSNVNVKNLLFDMNRSYSNTNVYVWKKM